MLRSGRRGSSSVANGCPTSFAAEPRSTAWIFALSALWLSGCATMPNGRPWGRDATLDPREVPWKRATVNTLKDPWTWAPLAVAGVLLIDDWDEDISEWAIEETPVFGSKSRAGDVSGDLRQVLDYTSIAATLGTPSGSEPWPWVWSKTKGLGFRYVAGRGTKELTDVFKEESERTRPDEEDTLSMPSGHTSAAFADAAWTRLSLDYTPMSDDLRLGSKVVVMGMAIGTGWARVEAGRHYPTDVLIGASLGNLVSRFTYEAFLGLPESGSLVSPELIVSYVPGEFVEVGLSWYF
jgi:hypothetical protein